ncbi:MAG: hypothetical protein EBY80_10995 [Actinobacteria bacterium]|nr:hypothetical protein [Actinomycetota bacterium]
MSNDTVRYLGLEWIDALTREVVTYHLQIADGKAAFGAGAAWPEDVRFEQEWDTAVSVATGQLNAQQAFITGRIRLYGDQQKLGASTPVFAALDAVFTTVRAFTVYE